MRRFKIVATAHALPPRVLTNADLETMVDTSDQWIVERTGIRERRIAADDVATSDLAAEALLKVCDEAGMRPAELDAIIVATSTPDTLFPSTACWVQHKLGLRGPAAFDVSAGCSGFVYGVELASSLLFAGASRRIAVIGAEVMSKVVDWTDRSTCVLFGDGAGAAILEATDEDRGLLASAWGADGTLARVLHQPAGGTRRPASAETVAERAHTVHMEGNTVFKHAVTAMSEGALEAMRRAGVTAADLALLIPHQANTRIMEATRARTGVAPERMLSVVDRYGNMSAATVPVALHEARATGRLREGDLAALTAFGTGFTWAAQVLRV